MLYPLNHTREKCAEIAARTETLLITHDSDRVFRAHDVALRIIPQTAESMWSGHFLPAAESLAEAEQSCNLAVFGLYKQAMASLRSVLELGLLSVYWNLGDDGHLVIRHWVSSNEDTPRAGGIWKRLSAHRGIAVLDEEFGVQERIRRMFGGLSNYIHTRGRLYSNDYGHPEHSRFVGLTFSEARFLEWRSTYGEIAWVVLALHVAKYPIATMRYDWSRKFGVDTPMFGGLAGFYVDVIEDFLGRDAFSVLSSLAETDEQTVGIMEWVEGLPDLTANDVEAQIRRLDMSLIEAQGFAAWEVQERRLQSALPDGIQPAALERIEDLRKWAGEAGLLESPAWILEQRKSEEERRGEEM